jgi:phosphatidylserine/phosphatidylglycerophosphate/cardiolipin synthase-like enzyme
MPLANPQVQDIITKYIDSFFGKATTASIRQLIDGFTGPNSILESEIRFTINDLIYREILHISQQGYSDDTTVLRQLKPARKPLEETRATIVMTSPRMRELGFLSIEQRNHFLETSSCFRKIIESSQNVLRICSPFLQKNVLSDDSLPDLEQLLYHALIRRVEVRILSREISSRRSEDAKWLMKVGEFIKNRKLIIVDYHLCENNSIFSSTHAKIICADYQTAYIGSAELRRNSLVTNFEIGCYLEGPQVFGVCEAFDLIFQKGKVWDP